MKNFYYLFIVLFIRTHTNIQIKENPIFLVKSKEPFVLSTTDNYYYVITKAMSLKIDKESGNIENKTINSFSAFNYIYIFDNSNNNYMKYSDDYFEIKYNPFISFENIKFAPKLIDSDKSVKIIGCIPRDNEFIIYGYINNYLLFSSQSRGNFVNQMIYNINDKLSCKFIDDDIYICAMIKLL